MKRPARTGKEASAQTIVVECDHVAAIVQTGPTPAKQRDRAKSGMISKDQAHPAGIAKLQSAASQQPTQVNAF